MKNVTIVLSILIIAFISMSFLKHETANNKYEYMIIHTPVSINKPTVYISKAATDMEIIKYKKNDFDMSTELARVQQYEDQGWELMQVVNQNSVDMNILFIMRKLR